jgi:hypothetical protein
MDGVARCARGAARDQVLHPLARLQLAYFHPVRDAATLAVSRTP